MKRLSTWIDAGEPRPSRRAALAGAIACLAAPRPLFAEANASAKAEATDISKAPPPSPPPWPAPEPWLELPPTPELPARAERQTLELDGTRLFYARIGSGRPVILLHGGMGNANYWGHQIAHLAERHDVIALDTRGHGRSPLTSPALGYDLFARDVVALMDALVIPKAAVIGWSDGAITGLELAMNHAERVDRLFAFGGNVWRSAMRRSSGRSRTFFDYATRCKAEYAVLSPDPDKWPQLRAGLRRMWHLAPEYSASALGRITAPTVIADGAYDEIIKPTHAAQMAGMIRAARPLLLPNASHFAMLQDPAGFNAALDRFMAIPPAQSLAAGAIGRR